MARRHANRTLLNLRDYGTDLIIATKNVTGNTDHEEKDVLVSG